MDVRILAIDDDPLIHKLLTFSIKSTDYGLQCVESAVEAKSILENSSTEIHTIILDWEMPGMSGIDLLKWLKKNEAFKSIPVIMLTSNSDASYIKQGTDAGAFYYVIKPFNKDLLLTIIRAAVREYLTYLELKKKTDLAENPLETLMRGIFHFKTLEQAHKLSILFSKVCPNPNETLIISELFVNAVEHGNLNITYSEKSELVENDTLIQEINRRLSLPEYAHKYATVTYIREAKSVKVTIEDQGKGFDFHKFLYFDPERLFDSHGRGIAMANSILNVQYKGAGNIVEVEVPV